MQDTPFAHQSGDFHLQHQEHITPKWCENKAFLIILVLNQEEYMSTKTIIIDDPVKAAEQAKHRKEEAEARDRLKAR